MAGEAHTRDRFVRAVAGHAAGAEVTSAAALRDLRALEAATDFQTDVEATHAAALLHRARLAALPEECHAIDLVRAAAPQLLELVGVGLDIAAELLVTAGDNIDRIRSEAAFAKMCGACPIPAGSGRTNGRQRLYRGGNRQANAALYRDVIVRRRWHQPTIDYVVRRTAEGLSKRGIIRCLKRYLAREIYRRLPPSTAQPHLTSPADTPALRAA